MLERRRMMDVDVRALEDRARAVRVAALKMIAAPGSGHHTPALSIADIIAVLYH
jgi:transketolase N-terminal domain/subunit